MLADVVAMFLADVIVIVLFIGGTNCATVAVVMPLVGILYICGRSYCQVFLADVIAILVAVFWQMLLPIWLMLLPFITCFVRQMLFARVADGMAYPGGCGV